MQQFIRFKLLTLFIYTLAIEVSCFKRNLIFIKRILYEIRWCYLVYIKSFCVRNAPIPLGAFPIGIITHKMSYSISLNQMTSLTALLNHLLYSEILFLLVLDVVYHSQE